MATQTAAEFDPTPAIREAKARAAMAKSNPLLALAYFIEAAADGRIECNVNRLSLLTDMKERAREAIGRHHGVAFKLIGNELYR